jgi:pilus assembly protein CpaF
MNTGHDGSMSTLHANSPREAIARLEGMILMAGFSLPSRAIRQMIVGAVDIVLQIARMRDGRRRVTHITEVVGMEGDIVERARYFGLEKRLAELLATTDMAERPLNPGWRDD